MKAATAMKATPNKSAIRIAVVESDPLRFVGFRALFDSEPDFELVSASLAELAIMPEIDNDPFYFLFLQFHHFTGHVNGTTVTFRIIKIRIKFATLLTPSAPVRMPTAIFRISR